MVLRDVDFVKVGARIRLLRSEKGWTQKELAEKIGCSNTHMSHIETGENKVSLTLLLRLSYALEVSMDYLLLDTPYARPEGIIDEGIARKLKRCSSTTLVTVNRIIDVLLDQQNSMIETYDKE